MVKLSKILLPILLLLAVFLNTTSVYAATWEIITHGGYEAAVSAWQRVALIFTDNNYKTLALPVAVLGAIILYLSVAARIALGGKGNLLAGWGTPFIIGLIIYIAFIIPKDSVVIYDETLNRGPQQINNIPRGIATIAGLLNKIENGFTNIIWTASDPSTDYRIQAGGTGFTIIGNFLMGVDALPVSFRATLDKYVHDCVLIELQRTGTQLNLNAIQSGQQKANFVIQQSRNPALFTVSYLNSTTGDAMTCQDAGQAILSWLNNPDNVKPMAQHACKSAGYSPNNVNSYNACVNTATSILATVTGNDLVALWGNNSLAAQSTLATAIQDVVTQYNPENAIRALATSQSMSSFIGMGVHANSWIPVIKETLMALAVGLTPLFAIILITPLAGRAFSIMAGMFVWLTVWGIIDAVIHSFAMEQAFNNATMLKSTDGYASGITAMMLFPTYSQKVVAMFGAVRWFGLMLSSVITGMFLKFGGTAMAMLAGSLSGTVQSTGAAYGEKVLRNPAGLYNDAIAQTSITNAAKMTPGGLAGYMAGMTAYQSGSMAGQARVGSELGAGKIAEGVRGGMMQGIASGIGAGNVIDQVGFDTASRSSGNLYAYSIGSGMGFGNSLRAFQAGEISSARNVADTQAFYDIAQKYGGVENLQRMISTKNYTALGQAIGEYAKQRGISYDQAAQEMGYYLGTREGLHTLAGKYHLDTVGEQGVLMTNTDKMLSETASAYAAFNFAKTLGYAGSWDDFAGRLQAKESQYSEASFTLNEEGAKRLNEQLKAQGYKNPNFSAGDRVSMAIDPNGNITVASGKRGAEKFTIDRAMVEKGTSVHTFNNRLNENWVRKDSFSWKRSGYENVVIYEPYRFIGVYQGQDGNLYHGSFHYAKTPDGRYILVTGDGTNLTTFRTASTFDDGRGGQFAVVSTKTYGPSGQLVMRQRVGGDSVDISMQKSFTGGWVYKNFLSSLAEDAGLDSGARALGAVSGILGDSVGGNLFRGINQSFGGKK